MKKFFAITLFLAMCAMLFAGCGGTPAASKSAVPLTQTEIDQMYTSPADFKGRTVELTGVIFAEVERDADGVYFQMFQDTVNSERITIVGYADPTIELTNGDYVKLTGVVKDVFEGENAFGAKLSAPSILADSVEVSSYKDIAAPTLKEVVPSNNTIEQFGYSVTVNKIELAKEETRVYLTVKNNGSNKFSLYSFNTLIIQDGKQFEEQSNYDAGYPEVQTDLTKGVQTEGIISFPPINDGNFKLTLEGSSDNYEETLKPFEFEIVM